MLQVNAPLVLYNKSCLRATITQTRLNNITILHVHKSLTDELNLMDIGNEFACESSHREGLFGKFVPTDLAQSLYVLL